MNRTTTLSTHLSRRRTVTLWVVQSVLAALFLYAGVTKFTMPIDVLAAQSGLNGDFMRFIGFAEALGGLGLVLPGMLRVARGLTPIAALGLTLIMVGAATMSAVRLGAAAALFPLAVGILTAVVARGRRADVGHGAPALRARPGARTAVAR